MFAVNKKVKRLQIRFQELTAFLPLLLVVGMFENSEGALSPVFVSTSYLPRIALAYSMMRDGAVTGLRFTTPAQGPFDLADTI